MLSRRAEKVLAAGYTVFPSAISDLGRIIRLADCKPGFRLIVRMPPPLFTLSQSDYPHHTHAGNILPLALHKCSRQGI